MKFSRKFAPGEKTKIRLDLFLTEFPEVLSRALAQKMIRSGLVEVNGIREERSKTILRSGDRVDFSLPPPESSSLEPVEYPLEIHYEDEHLLVLFKEVGIVVHPAPGNRENTLVHYLLAHTSLKGGADPNRPGIVHRLDKDTSGLMMVAKTERALLKLSALFAERRVHKVYDAIVYRPVKSIFGTVDKNLGRSASDPKKQSVREDGRPAITHWKKQGEYSRVSLLECRPETGRTHQIRVHLASMGHPIVGDPIYGNRNIGAHWPEKLQTAGEKMGMALHARELGFTHPITKEDLSFTKQIPERMTNFLRQEQDTQSE